MIVTTILTRWEMFSLTSDTSQARGERIASSLNTWGSSIVAFFFRSDCLQIVCRGLEIVILLLQFRLAKYIRLVKNEHLLSLQLAGQGLGKDKISTISFMTVSVFSSPKLPANINNYFFLAIPKSCISVLRLLDTIGMGFQNNWYYAIFLDWSIGLHCIFFFTTLTSTVSSGHVLRRGRPGSIVLAGVSPCSCE